MNVASAELLAACVLNEETVLLLPQICVKERQTKRRLLLGGRGWPAPRAKESVRRVCVCVCVSVWSSWWTRTPAMQKGRHWRPMATECNQIDTVVNSSSETHHSWPDADRQISPSASKVSKGVRMVFSLPPPTSLPPPQTEDEQLTRCSRLESNKKEKHEDWGEENVGIKQLFFRPRLFFFRLRTTDDTDGHRTVSSARSFSFTGRRCGRRSR